MKKSDKPANLCEAQKTDRQEKLCENQDTDARSICENEIIEKPEAITERAYVLAARNVHKSMIDALALLDLDVEFILSPRCGQYMREYGDTCEHYG